MKITICGSIALFEKMLQVKEVLEQSGHVVKLPPHEVEDEHGNLIPVKDFYDRRKRTGTIEGWIWDRKEQAIRLHFDKITWCDAILVLNYEKNNIPNYIGGNTFLEIGVAFYLRKKIYLLNSIPEMDYKEELIGMKPTIINGDFSLLD